MNNRNILLASIACAALAGLVSCGGGGGGEPTYTVGGTLTGSVGPVVLKLNGGGDITMAAPGTFKFGTGLAYTAAYTVTADGVQNCNVANGSGAMGTADVTNVAITCTTVVRSASLTGAQENPPVTTTASGRGAVIVNPTTKEITGAMSFTGLTPRTGGHHIHQAPAGTPTLNGPVIVNMVLAAGGGVAYVPPATVLNDAQYAALLAGELYFNVHTDANTGGEIRGQINTKGGVTAGLATLTGAQENPPVTTAATGRGMVIVNPTTKEITGGMTFSGLTPRAGGHHIHQAPAGNPTQNGPVIVNLTLAVGGGAATVPVGTVLNDAQYAALLAGELYFNVHTDANTGGEIRGQIVVQ